jgi:hypothetical protein
LQALARVLQPLAHLLIAHGVQLPSAVEQLKQTLVQAAGDFAVEGRSNTDTRVALLTGVHRKDVRRLRAQPSTPALAPPVPIMSVASCVVARWISEPRYLNADNSARRLAHTPRHAMPGEPVFSQLVAEVTRDVGARAVLDELQRLGVAVIEADAHVVLKGVAFVPQNGIQESFHFLGANVADHLATAVGNLDHTLGQGPWLEQSAFSQDLTAAQAQDLHVTARRLWARALQEFLQKATVAEQRSHVVDAPRKRVRFGVYFHESAMPNALDQVPPKARASGRKKHV